MKIDETKIDELAHLARLEFANESKGAIKKDLEKILEFCNKLNEVDTDSVEPLIYLSDERNVLRADEAKVGLEKSQALLNAPLADSDYFKVPKVITKK